MKKRRTLIISLLLVAALALGIGYAGFTSQLSIGGEAILNGVSESEVVITSIVISETAENVDYIVANANCGTDGTKNATVDVSGFKEVDEYAILTVTVSNPHPFTVNTTSPVLNVDAATNKVGTTDNEYFKIELLTGEDNVLPATIGADGSATFKIKITAKVIDPNAHTTNFTVGFSASSRDNT